MGTFLCFLVKQSCDFQVASLKINTHRKCGLLLHKKQFVQGEQDFHIEMLA